MIVLATTTETIAADILLAAAVVVALGALVGAIVKVWRFLTKAGDFFSDWNGEPDRPGVPGHAGVMARMQRMEAEQHTNGGTSLRDAIDRVDSRTAIIESLLRLHLEDGRSLLDVGLANDKNLWAGLTAAGIKIDPYIPLDREILDRNNILYDSIFGPTGDPLFGGYDHSGDEPDEDPEED